jgi:AraC-like DNA-binding protein
MHASTLQPSALRSHRLFETNDLDEARERISRVMQPHALTPQGLHHGQSHMDFVRFGGMGIGAIAFGTEMQVDVRAIDGYCLLMFCLSGQGSVKTNGASLLVGRDTGVFVAPGQPFRADLSEDCEQLVLRIDPRALSSRIGDDPHELSTAVSVKSERLGSWMQQLRLIVTSPELLKHASENYRIGTRLEYLLLDLLIDGHVFSGGSLEQTTLLPAFVRRAEEFIVAHIDQELRVDSIATAVGVHGRTLRAAFSKFEGTSPTRYIRAKRLDLAHELLLEQKKSLSVSEVALKCGFTHFGRFAVEYRSRFGEVPSETIASRCAVFLAAEP